MVPPFLPGPGQAPSDRPQPVAQPQPGRGQSRFVAARVAPLGSRLVLALVEDRTRERAADTIRRDFVANVSHELKTPIGALTLLSEAVDEASDDPVAVERFAARMRMESERLARLVQQIIELSRLQGDDPLEQADPVSIEVIAERAIDRVGVDRLRQREARRDELGA